MRSSSNAATPPWWSARACRPGARRLDRTMPMNNMEPNRFARMASMSDLLDRLKGINTRNATASTHARNGRRIGAHQQRGAAMKYIAAIGVVLALVLSLSAFIRAGALECKLKGEAL